MEIHRRTFFLSWWLVGEALTFREGTSSQVFRQDVINSSPLTKVSDDVRNVTPITPAHLALEGALYSLPDEVLTHEVQRGSDTCIRRSFLPISGSAGEDSTCISYQSDISGCVNRQPSRSETYC